MSHVLRQSTQVVVRIGPFMDSVDAVTPETGITLAAADQAEALKAAGAATADISGNTWAAITGAGGWYDLTLTTTDTNTIGDLTIVVQDTSVCLPVFARFQVVEEAAYDTIYAASALPASTTNITAGTITTTTNLTNLPTIPANWLTAAGTATDFGTEMATAIWTDTVAGDFTVASSIGKALYIANIAPGAAGGHFISGSNAGTTTIAALTITGVTTHTGNVLLSDGLTIAAPSTADRAGITVSGNGAGAGIITTGGGTGQGIKVVGGGTSGDGIGITTTSGHGISSVATGTTKHGIHAAGGATSSAGINAAGGGTGAGILATAGATGIGISAVGGATSGSGMKIVGTNGNAVALEIAGQGSAAGMSVTGGATGIGLSVVGGGTSGDGIKVVTVSGHGVNLAPVGTDKHGLFTTGGNGGTSDGIKAVAGTGGVPIRGDITGNIVGTITTVTTATNVTTVNGLAANVITAAATASDFGTEVAAAVWDMDATAHQTQGTFGQAIGDPVADTNTIFKAVVTDATGATVGADTTSILDDTGTSGVVVASIANNAITSSAIATDAIGADEFAQGAADKVWGTAARILTAGTNIALAKGVGVTGFNDITAASVWTVAVDGATTAAESMRLHNSALGAKLSGGGTGTEVFRDIADTKDRITATVDSGGNRTAITRDLT